MIDTNLSEEDNSKTTKTKNNKPKETGNYVIELPLQKDVVGKLIKALRKIRKYSQTRLGRLLGVQKAQISKLENSGSNITLGTMLKVFKALKAKVSFRIELDKKKDFKSFQEIINEEKGKKDS